MRCKCKVLSVSGTPASDGSIVPYDVMESYLNSQECKDALRDHKMIGSLSHRCRNIQANFPETSPALSKTVGKDDSLIIVSEKAPTPTHFIDKLYIEDGWLWCEIKILDETGMDDYAIQNIRRLKGMLSQGILPGVSAIIVGYWKSEQGTGDVLQKLVSLKGIDVTLNPSWKAAGITELLSVDKEEKEFSEKEENYTPEDFKFTGIKVKVFSDINSLGITAPKTSKINGQFTSLKAKEFSCTGVVSAMDENNSINTQTGETVQKEFTMATVKDRLREAKMSPRMYFRRVYISFKQAIRGLGGPGNLKEQDEKILKSLFTSDILFILNQVQGEVLKGKQLNTLLGCSSVSKVARIQAQQLQQPLRMAMMEVKRQGYLTKMRYQKLQEAYLGFIRGLMDDVFGSNPEPIPEENEETEDNNKK